MNALRFAILGAGAGGQTMAATLASHGYAVHLYDIDREKIRSLQQLGTIVVSGVLPCEGSPDLITDDLAAAMQDVDVIMVVTTTDAHKTIADQCVPYLRDGQIFLLNPGHVGGALEVSHIIRQVRGCTADVIIAEAGDLMYACRMSENGHPFQSGVKKHVDVAALPARDTDRLIERLGPVFPNLRPVRSVLETSFEGGGAMLHPIPSLMNVNRTDAGKPYDYYIEGITPSIARLVSACDRERLAVCRALGLDVPSLVQSLRSMYGLEQEDLYDLLQHNQAYRGLKSPSGLTHRFFIEDTLCGIVPLASIGSMLGVDTPIMNAFIDIAGVVCGRDFRREGRTAEQLGLDGKTPDEIARMIG